MAEKHGIHLEMIEFIDPSEAQSQWGSPYGVMNLVFDGRLLADHPISATRFKNILQRDLKLKPR